MRVASPDWPYSMEAVIRRHQPRRRQHGFPFFLLILAVLPYNASPCRLYPSRTGLTLPVPAGSGHGLVDPRRRSTLAFQGDTADGVRSHVQCCRSSNAPKEAL
jgi:hypothetical protein